MLIAIPTARGMRTLASRIISNSTKTNSVSASGDSGRPFIAVISVIMNRTGMSV